MGAVSKEIMEKAVQKWGKSAQILTLLEEMSELQKELIKNINRNKDNLDAVIDETADVEIMLAQMKHIYQIEQAVQERIPIKLQKVMKRLED